jgi:hypothetical protein
MSVLFDLLTDFLGSVVAGLIPGPSTDRGLMLLNAAGSLACAGAAALLYLRGHSAADLLLVIDLLIGTAGAAIGALYAIRHPGDRVLGMLCTVSSAIGPIGLWTAWV